MQYPAAKDVHCKAEQTPAERAPEAHRAGVGGCLHSAPVRPPTHPSGPVGACGPSLVGSSSKCRLLANKGGINVILL